jgi:short-subunit dehydrogenase
MCRACAVGAGRAIINVASTAGVQLPGNATYAACKAFVLLHAEAFHEELRCSGVSVTAVCPGPVRTEFQEVSEPLFADGLPGFVWRDPARVPRDGLRAAEPGKRSPLEHHDKLDEASSRRRRRSRKRRWSPTLSELRTEALTSKCGAPKSVGAEHPDRQRLADEAELAE